MFDPILWAKGLAALALFASAGWLDAAGVALWLVGIKHGCGPLGG